MLGRAFKRQPCHKRTPCPASECMLPCRAGAVRADTMPHHKLPRLCVLQLIVDDFALMREPIARFEASDRCTRIRRQHAGFEATYLHPPPGGALRTPAGGLPAWGICSSDAFAEPSNVLEQRGASQSVARKTSRSHSCAERLLIGWLLYCVVLPQSDNGRSPGPFGAFEGLGGRLWDDGGDCPRGPAWLEPSGS